MTGQLPLLFPPPADFDPWSLVNPFGWDDSTEALLAVAGQQRRRMWGRREAVTVLLWRLHHAPRRRRRNGMNFGRPTKAHAAEIERVALQVAGLAHLDDLDQEDPLPQFGPQRPPQQPVAPSITRYTRGRCRCPGCRDEASQAQRQSRLRRLQGRAS